MDEIHGHAVIAHGFPTPGGRREIGNKHAASRGINGDTNTMKESQASMTNTDVTWV